MLIRLVYASTLRQDVTEPVIMDIVDRASWSNARHGITGISAFGKGKVIQIIEGPDSEVDPQYDRIRHDERHDGVVMLKRDVIVERHFPELSMARRPLGDVLMLIDKLDS